jgi:hypothetical protein
VPAGAAKDAAAQSADRMKEQEARELELFMVRAKKKLRYPLG